VALIIEKFTYIELFAGIGGFRQALDELGGRCVFASEIDKFAAQSYKAIYGDAGELHGDITKIAADDIPDHDVLVGGFPCQAFSVAGQRRGFEDTRGTLFFEIARIASTKRPKLLLLENVKGLLSHDGGNTFEVMCRTLNEIGYAIDFRVLNSKYFGVPQNRERIFIVADRDAVHEPWNIGKVIDVVTKSKRRVAEFVRSFDFDWPAENAVTKRLRDVLEPVVDERYYLSEEKTAKLVSQLGDHPVEQGSTGLSFLGLTDEKGMDNNRRVYSVEGLSPTLLTCSGGGKEPKIAEPQEFSDGSGISYCIDANYSKGTSPGDIGKGRRTHVIQSEEVRPVLTPDRVEKRQMGRRFKEDGEEAFTLNTQDKHGVAIGKYPRYRIRKLTPRECWRLQGFPDAAFDKAKVTGVSDSQLYKQAGNAVSVPVISALGKQLITLLDEPLRMITRIDEKLTEVSE